MSVGALRPGGGTPTDALARPAARVRPPASWAAALAVFVLAFAALTLTHHGTPLALPRVDAIRALHADPGMRGILSAGHATHVEVIPFDARYDHVDAFRGQRLIATAEVGSNGVVVAVTDLRHASAAIGSQIANWPWVLGPLSVVFVLMSAVWPLRRLHNLDVLLAVAFVGAVVLYDHALPLPFMLLAYPVLALLAWRCAVRALGRRRPADAIPLFDHLTEHLGSAAQRRLLQLLLVAAGLIVAMVGLSSLHVVDVGYAVMEGATLLLHGTLPYHHIPDVLHGDTYPLGSYLLYVPLAALTPVHNAWDDADLTLAVAVVAALIIAAVLARRPAGRRVCADESARRAGLRAAIAWLSFPSLLVTVSSGTTDVVLALGLLGALVLWRRPEVATGVLAAGAWFKLVPLVLAPLALVRLRARAWGMAILIGGVLTAMCLVILVVLGGIHGPEHMVRAMAFQGTRTSTYAPWGRAGVGPGQQAVQALAVTLLATATWRMWREGGTSWEAPRLAALFAALLLCLQLAASYWSFLYLAWVVPLVIVMLGQSDHPVREPPA